jgi:dihydrodipicolinate synthase/N-acetylneuraminate lyase
MTFDNSDKDEQIQMFMSEVARQNAQLQRGYDRMAFIAGAIVGLFGAIQGSANVIGWIVLPLLIGGFFVFVRKASSR